MRRLPIKISWAGVVVFEIMVKVYQNRVSTVNILIFSNREQVHFC